MQNTSNNETIQSNATTVKKHVISHSDLPLSCPLPSASQWNAHPRVFLTLDEGGQAICPYCSTVYTLQED